MTYIKTKYFLQYDTNFKTNLFLSNIHYTLLNTDCELVSDKFKVESKSSQYNDNGTLLCKNGQMFYKDFFISNITARCNENAKWDFDSTNLNCYKGFL